MGKGGMTCYECGMTGHMARDCWSKRGRSGQQDDEVHVFVRDLMEEKEEKKKRAEEEQKRREEEKERKRELDIARRIEEMKLQLQSDIDDTWRRQQEEMANKVRESYLKTKTVKNGSPKVSPRSRTIFRAKSKRPVRRRHAKKRSSKQSTDSSTSSDSEISDSASSDSSEDSEEDLLRMVRLLREEKRRVKSKRKKARGRPVRKAPARTCEKRECSKKSTSTLTGEDEPRTPLTGGYKGIVAGCSEEGFLDYTLQVMQASSAKKVHHLQEICDKEGIKAVEKDEMIMELVRRQTE
ncbi:hypothetical protein CBR_g16935 [Chara braunii]|uniref:CCHC-type domain-containing protein n=1 Tax=Chara braunii TaxID=69332 RepID=A0A388KUH1_CHABU|nr:hypothetical protein CBR_g16935 [Chara braunii]|eukprot:GBG73593.1 hypothetical protein CBR_g16935 [Chara braunii]